MKLCLNKYFKGEQIFINLKLSTLEKNFDNGILKGSDKHLNVIIAAKKVQVDGLLQTLELSNELYKFSPKSLKEYLETGGETRINKELLFNAYVKHYIEKYDSVSTKQTFYGMLRKVAAFTDIDTLSFADISLAWIKDFEIFMLKGGLSVNTRGIYLRNIRTVYNDVIDRSLLPQDAYPFRRFKIKKAETQHRNISIDDMRYIVNFDCEKFNAERLQQNKHTSNVGNIEKYRDLFMLSFYLCGLNMKDLLFLKAEDIHNGTLNILREKTGIPIILRIEPEA